MSLPITNSFLSTSPPDLFLIHQTLLCLHFNISIPTHKDLVLHKLWEETMARFSLASLGVKRWPCHCPSTSFLFILSKDLTFFSAKFIFPLIDILSMPHQVSVSSRMPDMTGRADIEGSRGNVAMNAWLPQASHH
jgi:hypothetical protein